RIGVEVSADRGVARRDAARRPAREGEAPAGDGDSADREPRGARADRELDRSLGCRAGVGAQVTDRPGEGHVLARDHLVGRGVEGDGGRVDGTDLDEAVLGARAVPGPLEAEAAGPVARPAATTASAVGRGVSAAAAPRAATAATAAPLAGGGAGVLPVRTRAGRGTGSPGIPAVGHARARGDLRPGVSRFTARVAAAPRVATRASTPSGVHVHDVAGATDVARATATAATLTQGASRQVGARAAVTAREPARASRASAVGASAH